MKKKKFESHEISLACIDCMNFVHMAPKSTWKSHAGSNKYQNYESLHCEVFRETKVICTKLTEIYIPFGIM